jgi:hypothetical protein
MACFGVTLKYLFSTICPNGMFRWPPKNPILHHVPNGMFRFDSKIPVLHHVPKLHFSLAT